MQDQRTSTETRGDGVQLNDLDAETGEPARIASGRQDARALAEESPGDALAGEAAA